MALAMVMTDPRIDLMLKRHAAEQAIEDLIQFLDDTDADCDLEPNGDELDASYNERVQGGMVMHANEDDEDCGDNEPSLGAPEFRIQCWGPFWQERTQERSQLFWADGTRNDLEENVEDEGEVTDEDGGNVLDEPHDALDEGNEEAVGWTTHMDQTVARTQAFGWAQ